MAKRYEPGDVKFLVETFNQDHQLLVRWVLDQRVSNAHDNRAWDRLYNQVQGHLHGLSQSTGCHYSILNWGLPGDVEHYIQERGLRVD